MPSIVRPTGRLTLPRIPLTDRAFSYSCAAATNVAQTIARERQLPADEARARELAAIAAQSLLSGIAPAPRRMRAGVAQGITLPTLF